MQCPTQRPSPQVLQQGRLRGGLGGTDAAWRDSGCGGFHLASNGPGELRITPIADSGICPTNTSNRGIGPLLDSRFQAVTGSNRPGHAQEKQVECQTRKGGGEGKIGELGDLLNFTVANARRADLEPFAGALDEGAHRLQVDIPAALGDVMSVADAVAKLRPATANFANLCHKTEIS